jgi:tetratricopeptide (TPR) repeat protein
MGGGLAGYTGWLYGAWGGDVVLRLTVGGWLLTFLTPLAIATLGGGVAHRLYNPSGAGTPRRREYSQAESLAARGLYAEAVVAFESASAADPTDPTPSLRIARIHRDRLAKHEEAATWFKRAFERTAPGSGLALLVLKEQVELYTVKLGTPARAAPLLARLAEERPETPEGTWAGEELKRLKSEMG